MSILSAIVACAVLIATFIAVYALLRRRPGDIWEWSEDAYQPRVTAENQPRAITRIKSKDISWEINPQ